MNKFESRDSPVTLRLLSDGGSFTPSGIWYWDFHHRAERERGLDDRSDLYAAGAFTLSLQPDESFTLVLTTEADASLDGQRALVAARARQHELLSRANAKAADPAVQQLILAADQFIVKRNDEGGTTNDESDSLGSPQPSSFIAHRSAFGKTVIAGYHWFKNQYF